MNRTVINNKKFAFFDLDGTILDSLGVWADVDKKFFAKRGIAQPEDYFHGTSAMSFKEAAEYTIKRFGLTDTPQEVMNEWRGIVSGEYARNVRLKPHAKEYLEELHAGCIKLIIVTALVRELFEPALKNNGVLPLFSGAYPSDEVGISKSEPGFFSTVLSKTGANASEVIVFEDSCEVVKNAKSAGLTVVGVKDDRNISRQTELKSSADYYITSFRFAPMIK